jgi:hypothetical protein
MSKPSTRPNREEIKQQRKERKKQQQRLRQQQKESGQLPFTPPSIPNTCSAYNTIEEETQGRVEATLGLASILKTNWPILLRRLNKIPDPRSPKKTKHKLAMLMLYGILSFVLQIGSRRQANRTITDPMIQENLRRLFPELDSIPHADTLFRLLSRIDVNEIEQAQVDLVNELIRKKKFNPFRINNAYPVAIDGTKKLGGLELWSDALLQQRITSAQKISDHEGSSDDDPENEPEQYRYSVYVLEANLCFQNGMVIPLMTEFLDYREGDSERKKQDCETRAFHRLAQRIKLAFPRLPILLLLDGLYAQGPVMQRCLDYNWQFMIVLKDTSLSTVWEEYDLLVERQSDNEHHQTWGERKQRFRWVNEIRYEYGSNGKHHLQLHVVVCEEQWEVVDENQQITTKTSRHAWISNRPLRAANVHERCNLGARYRWGIEANFLVEKHQGYAYGHLFAKDWDAMRGYHYLMRIGHLINTLARFSSVLAPVIQRMGVRPFINFLRTTLSGPWFDLFGLDALRRLIEQPFRLRFV